MDFIYSQLDAELEKIVYTGINSTTTDIDINNLDRTIKVDVKCLPTSLVFAIYGQETPVSFNGSETKTIVLHDFTLDEVTPSSGYAKAYSLMKDGEAIGDTINVPLDIHINGCTLKVCSEIDVPVVGYKVGDHYLDITQSNSSEHVYCNVESTMGGLDVRVTALETKVEELEDELDAHVSNTNNPHGVTKTQVGLGDVVNKGMDDAPTSGSDKYVKSGGVYDAIQEVAGDTQDAIDGLVEDLEDGTVVPLKSTKAIQDEDGNNIKSTYSTKASVNALDERVDGVEDVLEEEVESRQSADSALGLRIDGEVANRTQAINTERGRAVAREDALDEAIENEEDRAIAKENALDNAKVDKDDNVGTLEASIIYNEIVNG